MLTANRCYFFVQTLWQIPENISLQDAAVLPVSYGTAILAIDHRARIQPGETVLVTAAAGATGLAVIDVATNVFRAKVIAAAGSDEKCKLAMQRGAQFSVNYSQGSLKDAVKKLAGSGGVNVAVDMVGGDVFLESLRRCVHCSVQNGQLGLHRTFRQLSLPAWFLSVFAAHVSCRHQRQQE